MLNSLGCGGSGGRSLVDLGPLGSPDANGVRVPAGFTARIVARTGVAPVGGGSYLWHPNPDGGATFATNDGGWIYVSNSETSSPNGGVGALRFDATGTVVDAYRVLDGSSRNCAGGKMPWGAWLSCEEHATGLVWECDPTGTTAAVARPALGRFAHEAAAYDPVNHHLYLSEDQLIDGAFYRFRPTQNGANGFADLSAGVLEAAYLPSGELEGPVTWVAISDPAATTTPTRQQATVSPFSGGEGLVYHDGVIYLSTKGDNRVWAYDVEAATLRIVYDAALHAIPVLGGVDNLEVTPSGEVLVAEDGSLGGANMQICVVARDGTVAPIVQIDGQTGSEITGPAFDPSYTRLYFSSQRGTDGVNGITYELSGPFLG